MPDPIPAPYKIYVEKKKRPADYAMPIMTAAVDHYNISYTISGDRLTITPDCEYTMHPGDVGVAAPHLYHRTFSLSDAPYERIMVKFTSDMVLPLITHMGRPAFEHFFDAHVYSFSLEHQNKIYSLFHELLDEFNNYHEHSEFILQLILNRLLLMIIEKHQLLPGRTEHKQLISPQIIRALNYLENYYLENPSLSDVASQVFLSPTYFSKLFKKQTGSTYSAYLDHLRLIKSMLLLKDKTLSISEVAYQSGFSNGNYFCDVFKKYYRCSPSQFRRRTL